MRDEEEGFTFVFEEQAATAAAATPPAAAAARNCQSSDSGGGPPGDVARPTNASAAAAPHTFNAEPCKPQHMHAASASDQQRAACSGGDAPADEPTPQQQQPQLASSSEAGDASSSGSSSSKAYDVDCCSEAGSEASTSSSSSSGAFLEVREPGMTEVVYVREGVAIWPSSTRRIVGRLSLVKQHGVLFISWLPYTAAATTPAAAGGGSSSGGGSASAEALQAPAPEHAVAAAAGAHGSSSNCSSPTCERAAAAAAAVCCDDWQDAAADVEPPAAFAHQQQQQQEQAADVLLHQPLLPALLQQQQQQQHKQPVLQQERCALSEQQQQHVVAAAAAAAAAGDSGGSGSDRRSLYAVHPIPLSDVRALVTHTSHLSAWHQLVVVLVSGLTLPPLVFKPGGVKQLLAVLKQHVRLARARDEPGTFLINDTADPLQRSLVCLDLTDIMLGAPPPGADSVAAPLSGAGGAAAAADCQDNQQQQHQYTAVAAPFELQQAVAAAVAAAAAATAAAAPWKGLGSALGRSQLGSRIRSVGALAVEGASSLVTAAVDGWASDVLRHFEQEVVLQEEEQQGGGSAAGQPQQQQHSLEDGGADHLAHAYTSAAAAAAEGDDAPLLADTAGNCPAAATAAAAPGDSSSSQAQDGDGAVETLVGTFELLEGAPADAVGDVLCARSPPPPPLTLEQLQQQHLDAEGVLVDEAALRQRVFTSGVDPAARREVWKFLLRVYPPGSSTSSRAALRQQHEASYTALKQQWHATSSSNRHRRRSQQQQLEQREEQHEEQHEEQQQQHEEQQQELLQDQPQQGHQEELLQEQPLRDLQQEQRQQQEQQQQASQQEHDQQQPSQQEQQQPDLQQQQHEDASAWRERRGHIDRDVLRTDRQHPFYRGREASAHLSALRDVLRAYCCYNPPLGYCQGMSDLASPLLVVNGGDEVDTFWCFVALMGRVAGNFNTDQQGMHQQLAALRQLVQVLDPQLHAFLEERDCLHYFFAFRWLLIHWKREFSFDQVLSLWEACWSCPLTRHLHIYLAAAVLIQHRRLLLADPSLDFDGLLAFAVEQAGRLDLRALLQLAQALVVVSGPAGEHCCEGLP